MHRLSSRRTPIIFRGRPGDHPEGLNGNDWSHSLSHATDPEYLHSYARGAIELGYVVFVAYRKQGYAHEALLGAISRAEEGYSIKHFVASISPRNLPSINLIAKLGFRKVGQHVDEIDGIEHVYLRDVIRIP